MSLLFSGKTVVLGVTGSIAAYKAAEIASQLTKQGAAVFPVMTTAATRIITPLTLEVLARNPVLTDLWTDESGWQPGHIDLADRADILIVAPATANTLANFARGLAPDALSAIYLATVAPVLLAPAMNGKMYAHPATRENLAILRARGHHFVDPVEGELACGYEGMGKLAPVEEIVAAVEALLFRPDA